MRENGITGAPGLAKGRRKERTGGRKAASRTPNRSIRLLRATAIYIVFAAALVSSAYFTARTVLDERERHQTEVDLRKVQEQRQGRVVHALKDGACRMSRFDNASGRVEGNVKLPCDTPIKDPVAAVRDFNWGGR